MKTEDIRMPLLFTPIYKDKIWGGRALETKLNRVLPASLDIGESWELSGFGSEQSTVETGPFQGNTLGDLLARMGRDLTGSFSPTKYFPLLYKFIDACDKLSVQVHPDDSQARAHGWGDCGKTECWYIADAKKDARIIVGFGNDTSRDEIEDAVEHNRLEEVLNFIPVTPGDVLFIPAGTVHAILDGTLIYEVQETSDTTLRLYDWGRTDASGTPRQLHAQEAIRILDTHHHANHTIAPVVLTAPGFTHAYRIACRYFAIEEYEFLSDSHAAPAPTNSFRVITVLGGALTLNYSGGHTAVPKGRTALIPASMWDFEIEGSSGTHCLLSYVPDLTKDIISPLKALGISREAIAALGGNPAKNDLIPLM